MEITKICNFCGKQINGEWVVCPYCGGKTASQLKVMQAADVVVKVSRPKHQKIEPKVRITSDRIRVIQLLCIMCAVLFLSMRFMDHEVYSEALGMVVLGAVVTYFLVLLLFSVMLKKFTGTHKIANALLLTAILCGGGFAFLVLVAAASEEMTDVSDLLGFLFIILTVIPIITGFVFYMIAGGRMISAKSDVLPLKWVGYTIVFSSVAFVSIAILAMVFRDADIEGGYVVARVLNILNAFIGILPLVALLLTLSACRKRLPADKIGDDILEAENNSI